MEDWGHVGEAVKMTWNSWVVVVAKMDGRECGWGKGPGVAA